VARGYDKPLYVLPFDHRASFTTGMFGWKGDITAEQIAQIAAAKRLVDWRAQKTTREAAAAEIARPYQEWVALFEQARGA
jgi:hypothetical protein